MKDSDLLRIGDKCLLIENIISEGGYGFIYKATEIDEKDFNRLKIRSPSPMKGKKANQKLYSKFLKGFKKGKEITEKSIQKKLGKNSLKKGQSFALKKMITQGNER